MTAALNLKSDLLSTEELNQLAAMRRRCARRILLATTLAASGHPGGSLSALDLLLVTYGLIRHDPARPLAEDRDRVVVSMGHISPGVYSVLAEYGYFSEEDFLAGFRRAGSGFPGHVERIVPGVEWDTGNLGQGLSAAVGMALALKLKGSSRKVIAFMGDGEQQKGQISEALRFASKYKLDNLLVLIDRNHLQICGTTTCVMPQEIRASYAASGWNVLHLENGHDHRAIHRQMLDAYQGRVADPRAPTVIVARTVMSKGISFMEDKEKYHGSPLDRDQLAAALAELGVENDFDRFAALRREPVATHTRMEHRPAYPEIKAGEPVVYEAGVQTDCRSAYGKALLGLAQANNLAGAPPLVAGISCDLEGSVKMGDFRKHSPGAFFEAGIQEHHAATMAGAMSREHLAVFFSTFGAFAVSEVYNQNRLNDINETEVKIVATHVGLDVGEDGPTHQCIDYLGLLRNLFRFSVFSPADPNQTDRIVRYVATRPGNFFVGMGRSRTPVVTREDGTPFFDAKYEFKAGKADWLRRGAHGTIITYGALVPQALAAWQRLREEGLAVGVLNMASLLPLDREAVIEAAQTGAVLTVEDHHAETGLGAMVGMVLAEERISVPFRRLGVSRYGASGKPADLYAEQGLDRDGIIRALKELK